MQNTVVYKKTAERLGVSQATVRRIVEQFLEELTRALQTPGESIEFRGKIGTFYRCKKLGKYYINPTTRLPAISKPYTTIVLRPASHLRLPA